MTIAEELATLLGPIFQGRFYAVWAPPDTERPYGVYIRVPQPEEVPTLDGKWNLSELEYEITAWSMTYDLSDELGREIANALRDYKSDAIQLIQTQGREDIADEETTLRGNVVRCLITTAEV